MPESEAALTPRIGIDLRPLLERELSGVGTYTLACARSLQAIFGDALAGFLSGRRLGDSARFDGLRTTHCRWPNPVVNMGMRVFGTPRADRLLDVRRYVLTNWNFLAIDSATELILIVHDLAFERNPNWFSPKQRLWHRLVAPRTLVARADRLIAVSEWTKEDLVTRYAVPADRITVVYPTADTDGPSVRPPAIPDEPFLLFVGNVEERKNPLGLLAAFEKIAVKHPRVRLVLAGRSGFGAERLVQAVRQSPWASRIHLLGYVSAEERRWLYEHATCFVYPSFYEGFGIPLLEAMTAGLPIVTSNRSSMPEVVADAGVLVDPGNVTEIALALDEILSNDGFARLLGERGRERASRFPVDMTPALREFFVLCG